MLLVRQPAPPDGTASPSHANIPMSANTTNTWFFGATNGGIVRARKLRYNDPHPTNFWLGSCPPSSIVSLCMRTVWLGLSGGGLGCQGAECSGCIACVGRAAAAASSWHECRFPLSGVPPAARGPCQRNFLAPTHCVLAAVDVHVPTARHTHTARHTACQPQRSLRWVVQCSHLNPSTLRCGLCGAR